MTLRVTPRCHVAARTATSRPVGSRSRRWLAASPRPAPATRRLLLRMDQADCAHVDRRAKPHHRKARNWLLEGAVDSAARPNLSDIKSSRHDDCDLPHVHVDDNLDIPVIELCFGQINRHGARTRTDPGETARLPAALEANLSQRGRDLHRLLTAPCCWSEFDRGRQAANHRGEVSVGTSLQEPIKSCLKAILVHLGADQASLQELDPALPQILGDRGLVDWEPVGVHASTLSPDAPPTAIAGPAPALEDRAAASPVLACLRR